MNPIKEYGIGMFILMVGSPFYFVLIVDIFRGIDDSYIPILPVWASIIISISFCVGFVMMFTIKEEMIPSLQKREDES